MNTTNYVYRPLAYSCTCMSLSVSLIALIRSPQWGNVYAIAEILFSIAGAISLIGLWQQIRSDNRIEYAGSRIFWLPLVAGLAVFCVVGVWLVEMPTFPVGASIVMSYVPLIAAGGGLNWQRRSTREFKIQAVSAADASLVQFAKVVSQEAGLELTAWLVEIAAIACVKNLGVIALGLGRGPEEAFVQIDENMLARPFDSGAIEYCLESQLRKKLAEQIEASLGGGYLSVVAGQMTEQPTDFWGVTLGMEIGNGPLGYLTAYANAPFSREQKQVLNAIATQLSLIFDRKESLRSAKVLEEKVLRARMSDHDVLAIIKGLSFANPVRQIEIVDRLRKLLKLTMQHGTLPWVPVVKELKLVTTYFGLKQEYLQRPTWSLHIDPADVALFGHVMIPPHLIFALTDNAVKHGLESTPEKYVGRVTVTLAWQVPGQCLKVIVEDNGVGFDAVGRRSKAQTGLGLALKTVKRRVDLIGSLVGIKQAVLAAPEPAWPRSRYPGTRITLIVPVKIPTTPIYNPTNAPVCQ